MVRPDLKDFLSKLPKEVTVVAATKYVDASSISLLYKEGIKDFGENRVDSFLEKNEELKDLKDAKWHFIGHLQRNKAKLVANKIDVLHSLDSIDLANKLNELRETPLDTFIEVSINLEENKNGVPYYEAKEFIKSVMNLKNIHLVGLMMMAHKNPENAYQEFLELKILKEEIEKELSISLPYLSMGMSDDYLDAIKAGATHIRLGRILYK